MNKTVKITTPPGKEYCSADEIMYYYRYWIHEIGTQNNFPKNINVDNNSVNYWLEHSDVYYLTDNSIKFYWEEDPKHNLPPLLLKVVRDKDEWRLSFLREFGDDKLYIDGKSRKGKNKNGKIDLQKSNDVINGAGKRR